METTPSPAKGISGEHDPWRVPLTQTTLGHEEEEAAVRVLRRRWLSMGEEVSAFEREFAAAVGTPHAIAVTNGTHALSMAYEATGLVPGDVIAIPVLTFVAALNTALRRGLRPVLYDIAAPDDLTPCNESLRRLADREPRLRAVVSMPYGGWSQPMAQLRAFCRDRGLALVEDACHGALGRRDGAAIGAFGDAACFSFFPNKNMTTGEGGMITTADDAIAARLRRLRSHGMTALTWDRHRGHATGYDVELAGENYRMDEIRAAIGRAQLAKLPAANASRREAAARIIAAVRARSANIAFPFHERPRPADELSAAHLLVGLLPPGTDRAAFREAMASRRIQTSVHYPPLYSFSHARAVLAAAEAACPVMASVANRIVTLPLAPNFTTEQEDYLAAGIADSLAAATGAKTT